MADPLVVAGVAVAPGSRQRISIPVARRPTHADVSMEAEVVRGRLPGPRLFVCAGLHGDEINGIEIIRRLLRQPLRKLRGTLTAVPIVNVHGFIAHSRLLPDRRDLNRSFPGSPKGSLASRLAHQFMESVVNVSSHGIDLHTGAVHRENLPQIRACLDDPDTEKLARAFGTPVLLNANLRDGSLRQAVLERAIPMLVYEGGEALRFDETAIRAGLRGILGVMRLLNMLPASRGTERASEPFVARSSRWVRAPESGLFRARLRLGQRVRAGDPVGVISDPLGTDEVRVEANESGIVIGRTKLPVANEGDALVHIASFEAPHQVEREVASFQEELGEDEPAE